MKQVLAFLTATLLVLGARLIWADGVTVEPWGPTDNQGFDHDSPPTDPPLPAGEDADTRPFVSVSGGAHTGIFVPSTGIYTITNVAPVTVSGHSTIRLPDNADETLAGHEDGHDSLGQDEYDKNAKRKTEEAMKGFGDMTFKGEGATLSDRIADAVAKADKERDARLKRAQDAILAQINALNKKYDDLTAHGTSDTVNTADGQTKAKAERDKAAPAGQHSLAPALQSPFGGSQQALAQFGQDGEFLNFQPQIPITFANGNTDPLLSRGLLTISPFVFIGPTDSGAIHLADTALRITDIATGDVLLQGYLFEAAYMPSSVPGFAGMVQAYLDIPPDFASGINNTIGSPFLAGLASARDGDENTTFWFFAASPLFDDQGQPISGGSTGIAALGIGTVPEPGTWALLALGAAILTEISWMGRGFHFFSPPA